MRLLKITFFLIIVSLLLINCHSVEKYNAQIAKQHTVTELQEDVDFIYEKLQKLHPNLYQYTSKDSLDYYFNNFKQHINKPMSSLEFYKVFSPIITKIRQGHTSLYPAKKRQTKKDIKKTGRYKNPFRTLRFNTLHDNVYIEKGFGKDSTIVVGSQLLNIEQESMSDLTSLFKTLITGDGYNTTFVNDIAYKEIGWLYGRTHKHKDSLQLTLQVKDSIYTKYLYSISKKDTSKKDSVSNKKLSYLERKKKKKAKKKRSEWEYIHGYNKLTKETTLSLQFITSQDSTTIAYMKIRNFMQGSYGDFFEESFAKIDSLKTNYFILDLRNNHGGRLTEIDELYAYLSTDDEYRFLEPLKMTKPSHFSYNKFHNTSILDKILTPISFPIAKVIQLLKVKNIDGAPHFKVKSSKIQKAIEKNRFKGKVYVLINGGSFSASALLSNKLQATKRAYFVGDETGGAYNSTVAGQFASLEMPHSKNVLRTGLMLLNTPHQTTPDGYGIKPDKYIPVTTLDIDEQLEWILHNINTK